MKLFVTIFNDALLLSHFLRHYARAGITDFFVAVPQQFKSAVTPFLRSYNITLCDGLDVDDSLLTGSRAVSQMRQLYQAKDEWVVIVDLDEFIEFDKQISLITSAADSMDANIVRGIMLDRFSLDGQLTAFDPDADLSVVYPIKSRFIRNVMGGCDHKGVLVKGHIKPAQGAGHHRFDDERTFSKVLAISHYKWIPGALDRLRASHSLVVAAGIAWSIEYKRALEHYQTHGRFAWETFGGKLAEEFELDPTQVCTECGGAISEDEYAYSVSHFSRGLCRLDQRRQDP
jgi:glycosyl transferase family 2